jgi:hypothetical protein
VGGVITGKIASTATNATASTDNNANSNIGISNNTTASSVTYAQTNNFTSQFESCNNFLWDF